MDKSKVPRFLLDHPVLLNAFCVLHHIAVKLNYGPSFMVTLTKILVQETRCLT